MLPADFDDVRDAVGIERELKNECGRVRLLSSSRQAEAVAAVCEGERAALSGDPTRMRAAILRLEAIQ